MIRPRIQVLLLSAGFIVLLVSIAYALEVPYLTGRVMDDANILSSTTINDLDQMLASYEQRTTNQFAVLTIHTLDGESLEDFSLRVAETWKLGKKGTDNGALLLIVKDDRKLRIETGYGLEASLTDAVCSYIINNEITPHFKDGDFDAGVRSGVEAMIRAADGKLDMTEKSIVRSNFEGDTWGALLFALLWFSIVGLFTIFAVFSPGCAGWFLYAFLVPFYAAGSFVLSTAIGPVAMLIFAVYLFGMPVLRIMIPKTAWGKKLATKFTSSGFATRGGWSSGGWSTGGSSFSSGSSFSGGGGSFGGGGSSGSW